VIIKSFEEKVKNYRVCLKQLLLEVWQFQNSVLAIRIFQVKITIRLILNSWVVEQIL